WHARQSLLQSAHSAAGCFPALRWVSSARGSAGGSGPSSGGNRSVEAASPGAAHGRVGGFLSPGVATSRWAGGRAGGADRFCWPGPHGAELPRVACGRAGGPALAAEANLPDVQRLYHGAAQRDGVGVLSARPVLQGSTRSRGG